MQYAHFLRRKQAGKYLKEKYGFGSERTLAKLACLGGGPEFRKAGPMVLYEPTKLDDWALSQIGKSQHSTSDRRCVASLPTWSAKSALSDRCPELIAAKRADVAAKNTSDHSHK